MTESDIMQLVYKRVPETFFSRFYYYEDIFRLWIITPWFSPLEGKFSLSKIFEKVQKESIRTTIVTRWPEEPYHFAAIKVVSGIPNVEIILNNNLHAKLYISLGTVHSLGLLASSNLTKKGLEGIEVGLLVRNMKWGTELIHELAGTAKYIRNADGHTRVKEIGRDLDRNLLPLD